MKKSIVKFSKEFITETGLKEWVGINLRFNEERESGTDALRRAETIVNEYQRPKGYIMQYNMPYQTQSTPAGQLPEERQVGLTPELIMGCEDITTLQTFYLLVDKSNDETLKIVYNNRKAQLVAKETKEILSATEKNIKAVSQKISNNVKD